jgi:predicted kinase
MTIKDTATRLIALYEARRITTDLWRTNLTAWKSTKATHGDSADAIFATTDRQLVAALDNITEQIQTVWGDNNGNDVDAIVAMIEPYA